MLVAYLEDDQQQAETVTSWLLDFGYEVERFATAQSFLDGVADKLFDVFILDWELPDGSGIEVLEKLRNQFKIATPVLFCSQRDGETDVVKALEVGADDYMRKPLLKIELRARMEALVRRSVQMSNNKQTLELGPFKFDLINKHAFKDGTRVDMTEKEFDLAACILSNPGRILSRAFLLERVWGISSNLNTRTVDVHVSRVRKSLGITPEIGYRIKTIYQHGYRLEQLEVEAEV